MQLTELFAIVTPLLLIPTILSLCKINLKYRFPVPLFVINGLVVLSLFVICNNIGLSEYERLGGYITSAEYYEEWDEWVTATCTREESDGVDSDGKPKTKTVEYDCSYRQYHPPYWVATTSMDTIVDIDEQDYNNIVKLFGNNELVDLHRHFYTIDGNKYVTKWPGTDRTLQPYYTYHRYTNKVRNTNNVFSYPTVEDKSNLYEYPRLADKLNDPAILGQANGISEADRLLQVYNAKMGAVKQIRIWILLFHNLPRTIGVDQESYWKGGHKNELIICIGLNDNGTQWCHPICWSPDNTTTNEVLKIDIRNYVEQQKRFDLVKTVEYITQSATSKFQRKQFKEFDYLEVTTPVWPVILTHLFSLTLIAWYVIAVLVNEDSDCVKYLSQTTVYIKKTR